MEDADADIRLQRVAGDLIGEFSDALEPFLYGKAGSKTGKTNKANKATTNKVKSRVRIRDADHMVGLLDPFQELPQLLDAHLAAWLPLLADAFLQAVCSTDKTRQQEQKKTTADSLLCPTQTAVARILYTLCKVRGEKVIVTFLPVEARHLDPLLGALEADGSESTSTWSWEERYIVLLWLAQLLLAPFDLATIGGEDYLIDGLPVVPGFSWPASASSASSGGIPPITLRVLPLSIHYLAHPGKERDAARALLVRVAMRRDMQQIGVRHALVAWALGVLGGTEKSTRTVSAGQPYFYIGTLSFLAGILSAAAGASDMDDALADIFAAVHAVAEDEEDDGGSPSNAIYETIRSSALARKMMIKAMRAIVVRYIQKGQGGDNGDGDGDSDGDTAVETTIGYLLGRLADNDTPVRFAASKALAVIALRLDQDMAAQVIDAVLEALERNVLYDKSNNNDSKTADLTAVDPLEWHGLMLTLAHLLYRRSPPLDALPGIVRALQRGLAFERRSVSGSATGTNVRDAACFGIWALARRYTTAELASVSLSLDGAGGAGEPVLQTLATDLVVAASLDPAGNIRRGSSAALQEMIGRHPDTVCAGIPLVQVVDYHGVALRARAATDVAQQAAALDLATYGTALRRGLLGWRGVGDAGDATARRVAAASFGHISQQMAMAMSGGVSRAVLADTTALLVDRVQQLQPRQVEERHGLLLALAAVLDTVPELDAAAPLDATLYSGLLSQVSVVLETCQSLHAARRPDLVAEAASRLIVSSFPVAQALARSDGRHRLVAGPALLLASAQAVSSPSPTDFEKAIASFAPSSASHSPSLAAYTNLVASCLAAWLPRQEADVVAAASDAGVVLLVLSGASAEESSESASSSESSPPTCTRLVASWADTVRKPGRRSGAASAAASSFKTRGSGATAGGSGYIFALAKAYPLFGQGTRSLSSTITTAILDRWTADKSIDTRVALLQALAQSGVLQTTASSASATPFAAVLAAALDDYTIDARGDVGSHVRLQALRATQVMGMGGGASSSLLQLKTLRLAAEKLDRVRMAAQEALVHALGGGATALGQRLQAAPCSSQAYFETLLAVAESSLLRTTSPTALTTLMRGYVTSADTGNEELVVASRAALVQHVGDDATRRTALWTALGKNLPSATTGKGPPDRIVVPTIEVIVFLFYAGVFGKEEEDSSLLELCAQVSTAAAKAGSVRKVEACIKLYGAVAQSRSPLASPEARRRLAALLQHPWPRVRAAVVDELWGLGLTLAQPSGVCVYDSLKSTDWGVADAAATDVLAIKLGLV